MIPSWSSGSASGSGSARVGEKRAFIHSHSHSDDSQPNGKRLYSVVAEAMAMNSCEKFCSSLEPMFRKVVAEEIDRVMTDFVHNRGQPRSSPMHIHGSIARDLRLYFTNTIELPVFTDSVLKGKPGAFLSIELRDSVTQTRVESGLEAFAKLDVVILDGDFANDDGSNWSREDFEASVQKERDGRRPLLLGDTSVTLVNGVGNLGNNLQFTDNSSWIRSRKFRLGVRLSFGCCDGTRIREAKTEAFMVKDHRGEAYKKHYPPVSVDDVWRLKNIGRDGAFHKRLVENRIQTVEDFMRLFTLDPQKLKHILGNTMSTKMWESTIEHAKTCTPDGKLYYYDVQIYRVFFDNLYHLKGVTANNGYHVNDNNIIKELISRAFGDIANIKAYEDGALVIDQAQGHCSIPTAPMQPAIVAAPPHLYDMDAGMRNLPSMIETTIDSTRTGLDCNNNNNALPQMPTNIAPGLNQRQEANISLLPNYSLQSPQVLPYLMGSPNPWDATRASMEGCCDEGLNGPKSADLRAGDYGMLNFKESGGGGYGMESEPDFPSPFLDFQEESGNASNRAYVGWLKLKAALRWGVFVRKYRAGQKPHLEEIE